MPKRFCGLCGRFPGELKMNLLEKYKVMSTTGEREKVKKGFLWELPAISAQYPPVGSNRVAAPAVENVTRGGQISMTVAWTNPHPKGTKAARDFSRKAIEEARGLN